MTQCPLILISDDDPVVHESLSLYLDAEGYEHISAYDGEQALKMVEERQPDLMILDLMMPKMSGIDVCRTIRLTKSLPIIMLTAKSDVDDRITGLEMGADDYLAKPFAPEELLARIRALLRRSSHSQRQPKENTLTIGTISLDLDGRNAYRAGVLADLTAKEFDVIEFLMRNPNRVYSREALLDTIWAYEYRSDIRTVDVHIRRLREKLEENPAEPQYIMTKWGVGYYFRK